MAVVVTLAEVPSRRVDLFILLSSSSHKWPGLGKLKQPGQKQALFITIDDRLQIVVPLSIPQFIRGLYQSYDNRLKKQDLELQLISANCSLPQKAQEWALTCRHCTFDKFTEKQVLIIHTMQYASLKARFRHLRLHQQLNNKKNIEKSILFHTSLPLSGRSSLTQI